MKLSQDIQTIENHAFYKIIEYLIEHSSMTGNELDDWCKENNLESRKTRNTLIGVKFIERAGDAGNLHYVLTPASFSLYLNYRSLKQAQKQANRAIYFVAISVLIAAIALVINIFQYNKI